MPQFSLKDLFVATSIMSVGLAILLVLAVNRILAIYDAENGNVLLAYYLYLAGCGVIGAGIMFPFKKMLLGASIGILLGFGFGAILVVITVL